MNGEMQQLRGVLESIGVLEWPDLDSAFDGICRAAGDAIGTARVSVWRYDPSLSALRCVFLLDRGQRGSAALTLTAESCPRYWKALHASRSLPVSDARNDMATSDFLESYIRPLDIGALLDTSVRVGNRTLAILCFEHVGGPREWTLAEQEFVASVGERIGLVIGLDEQRRLESQLRLAQKMEALGLLAGGIAHDFNNVLSIVMGGAQGALRYIAENDHAAARADLEIVLSAVDRARQLTRKLLAVAREEPMRRARHDLNAVVRDVVPVAASSVRGRPIQLELDLTSQPLPALVDRTFVDQAVLNLVSNAEMAMPRGGKLRIRTQQAATDSGTHASFMLPGQQEFAQLSVSDTGEGISADRLERIFDPFFTTKGDRGTGLGLAVVYSGMRDHDGMVRVESEVGRGTAVHLFFPIAP